MSTLRDSRSRSIDVRLSSKFVKKKRFLQEEESRIQRLIMFRLLSASVAIYVLAGCGVVVTPYEAEANEIHGQITFIAHVEYNDTANWEKTLKTAQRRCRTLGYENVKAFEGIRKKCVDSSIYDGIGGCYRWELERIYQRTNEPGTS